MDPTNKQHCMDKEEFHWVFGVHGVDFQQNLGQKSVMDPAAVSTISLATNSHRDITNRNQPLLFFHMDPTNKQHCMDKEEFHWVFGVLRGWFSATLGSKISDDPSCQLWGQH
jgi:hypothetical protein